MTTLLLSHRYTPDSNSLFSAACSLGWNVERVRYNDIPYLDDPDLVFYGETLLADYLHQELGLNFIQPTIDWLTLLPQKYLHRKVELMTLLEISELKNKFIKPVDEKLFPARVYQFGKEIYQDGWLDPDWQVLVSEPVKFEIEFRFFILDRQIISFSPYIRNGQIAKTDIGEWWAEEKEINQANEFVVNLISNPEVILPPALVIDVGLISDFGWAVVEANQAWASGLCGSNPDEVLKVLKRCVVSSKETNPTDKVWLRYE